VAELLHAHGLDTVKLRIIGLPDKFVEHGAPAILRELYGLSSGHIKDIARELVRPGSTSGYAGGGASSSEGVTPGAPR
jgi:deoxyxylulose-5-phosphate synthase